MDLEGLPSQKKENIEETNKDSLLLIAENDEKIIGFLSADRGHANKIRHRAYIVIGILKNFRGKGIGLIFIGF